MSLSCSSTSLQNPPSTTATIDTILSQSPLLDSTVSYHESNIPGFKTTMGSTPTCLSSSPLSRSSEISFSAPEFLARKTGDVARPFFDSAISLSVSVCASLPPSELSCLFDTSKQSKRSREDGFGETYFEPSLPGLIELKMPQDPAAFPFVVEEPYARSPKFYKKTPQQDDTDAFSSFLGTKTSPGTALPSSYCPHSSHSPRIDVKPELHKDSAEISLHRPAAHHPSLDLFSQDFPPPNVLSPNSSAAGQSASPSSIVEPIVSPTSPPPPPSLRKSPLDSEAVSDTSSGWRDYEKMSKELAAAGFFNKTPTRGSNKDKS